MHRRTLLGTAIAAPLAAPAILRAQAWRLNRTFSATW